jgi:hypothetical protein
VSLENCRDTTDTPPVFKCLWSRRNVLRMPELRERRFPNFEVVRSDEVSLDFLPFVRGVEVTQSNISGDNAGGRGRSLNFLTPRRHSGSVSIEQSIGIEVGC